MFPFPFSYEQDPLKILRHACHSILTPQIHTAHDALEQDSVPVPATAGPVTDFALKKTTAVPCCAQYRADRHKPVPP